MLAGATLLALPGCGLLGGDEEPATGTPTTEGDATTEQAQSGEIASLVDGLVVDATFAEGPCQFTEPTGTEPRCGTVTVPLDWETGEGTMTLAVAVFPSTADAPADDPVAYLEGGPGGHSLDTVQFIGPDLVEPLAARGDVVFFDQRGVGLSEPALACDEVTTLQRELEDDPDVSEAESDTRFAEALQQCSERITESGVDLAQFTSVNNAHDVEAIRVALGYDRWNLLGISYGTRLGLEVLRQHPDHVRSVVLDSVLPPQADGVVENPATFLDSFQAVVDTCAAEPACAAQGDLGERLGAVIADLEAEPVEIEIQNIMTGETDTIFADGFTLLGIVTQALYSPSWFTDLPELVTELEAGGTASLVTFLSQIRSTEAYLSDGMFYATVCNEEVPFSDRAEAEAAVPDDPFDLTESDTFDFASNVGPNAFDTCEAFGSTPAGSSAGEAVESDVPTLLMTGSFDPVTPPAFAEMAAATLTNSSLVVAPKGSHGISPTECGMSIVTSFLDDPDGPADGSCLESETFSFVADPSPEAPELVEFTYTEAGATFSGVRPEGWRDGGSGDFYRNESFLDTAQLVYLSGESQAGALLAYVEQQWDVDLIGTEEWVDPSGEVWQHRSAIGPDLAFEWYERDFDGRQLTVVMAAAPEQIAYLSSQILVSALDEIEVGA
jgi:pimeloyl-ACP methyl ester carboxylesterase